MLCEPKFYFCRSLAHHRIVAILILVTFPSHTTIDARVAPSRSHFWRYTMPYRLENLVDGLEGMCSRKPPLLRLGCKGQCSVSPVPKPSTPSLRVSVCLGAWRSWYTLYLVAVLNHGSRGPPAHAYAHLKAPKTSTRTGARTVPRHVYACLCNEHEAPSHRCRLSH